MHLQLGYWRGGCGPASIEASSFNRFLSLSDFVALLAWYLELGGLFVNTSLVVHLEHLLSRNSRRMCSQPFLYGFSLHWQLGISRIILLSFKAEECTYCRNFGWIEFVGFWEFCTLLYRDLLQGKYSLNHTKTLIYFLCSFIHLGHQHFFCFVERYIKIRHLSFFSRYCFLNFFFFNNNFANRFYQLYRMEGPYFSSLAIL